MSTAIWKGVLLRDLLNIAAGGVTSSAQHACFEGADVTPKGNYGTSVPLQRVFGETDDVMIAYEMNGERLTPDHGYPLRVVVPGCIGGRSVCY